MPLRDRYVLRAGSNSIPKGLDIVELIIDRELVEARRGFG
jgi:hypothetical protein